MTSQDVVTYQPEKIRFVTKDKQLKVFEDENLNLVIKFLRKGPMTIPDLITAFKKHGDKKSDKSIYRYLNKLIKAKLVAKAGKRITTLSNNDLQSETLYIRTADAFVLKVPLTEKARDGTIKSPVFETMYYMLKNLFKDTDKGLEDFKAFFDKLDNEKDDYIVDLYTNAPKNFTDDLFGMKSSDILYALDYASWLAILMKYDLKEKLDDIYT